MATDITSRKEAEKQLKESKDRFREILDTAQRGIRRDERRGRS